MQEFLICDWRASINEGRGKPEITIISLYRYMEQEIKRLNLFEKNVLTITVSQSDICKIESIDDIWPDIQVHIESYIFQNVYGCLMALGPVNRADWIIYSILDTNTSNNSSTTNIYDNKYKQQHLISKRDTSNYNILLQNKFAALGFLRLDHLGLGGNETSPQIQKQIATQTFTGPWCVVGKELCRALVHKTPSCILSHLKIVIKLISYLTANLLTNDTTTNNNNYNNSNTTSSNNKINSVLDTYENIRKYSVYYMNPWNKDIYNDNKHLYNYYDLDKEEQTYIKSIPNILYTKLLYSHYNLNHSSNIHNINTNIQYSVNTDNLMPVIVWVLLQTNPVDIDKKLWLASTFRHPDIHRGEEEFCLTQVYIPL